MDLVPILKKIYPQNSIGGECVAWLRNIFDQPAMGIDPKGNDVNLKIAFVRENGCIAANIAETYKGFRIGDCVFTTEGATKNWLGQWRGAGHEACVTGFDKDCLILAESNFDLDHKVKYGRRLQMNSPKIIGIYRPSFKIDLGLLPIPFSYDVFINNQTPWDLGVIQDAQNLILVYSNGNLKPTLFPLQTSFKNWWYGIYEQNFKVISRDYITETVMPLSFTNHNAPSNAVSLVVSQKEWQGAVLTGGAEIAYYHYGTNPAEIQIACDEHDKSPWYDMPLIQHALIHEIGHFLRFVAGQSDTTHKFDNPTDKHLNLVYSDIDFNRVVLNL